MTGMTVATETLHLLGFWSFEQTHPSAGLKRIGMSAQRENVPF